jgi:hypothetical protein
LTGSFLIVKFCHLTELEHCSSCSGIGNVVKLLSNAVILYFSVAFNKQQCGPSQ